MDKNIIGQREERRLSVPFGAQSTVTECGEEFTLPDYYPEVRRVVSTLCRVLPEGWYEGGDSGEQSGVVTFTVIYLGDDGSLRAVPLTSDYTATVQLPPSDGGEALLSADTAVENVTCRATGPRRLSLKARLRTTVTGNLYRDVEASVTDMAGGAPTAAEKISIQTLEESIPTMRRGKGKTTGTVSGEFRERAGTKPVMCDGEITVNEASVSDGSVILRGEAVLWCICFGADGLYCKVTSKSPFEERIPLEGDVKSGSARGWGRCASATVKDSEDGVLLWDMEYDLECEAVESVTEKCAADMYSTVCNGHTESGECESLAPVKCGNGRLTLTGTSRRSGTATTGDYIIGSFGKAVADKVEAVGTRLTVSGVAEVRVLICGGGEVAEEAVKLPFRYECDSGDSSGGELMWRCDCAVVDSSVSLDGESVRVTAELCISIFAAERTRVRYVAKLELDRAGDTEESGGRIRIYYPTEDETPWDIAKKYRIPRNAVGDTVSDGVIIE